MEKDSAGDTKQHSLRFDSKTFGVTAVKKAAYKYLRAFSANITMEGEVITCDLTFSSPISAKDTDRLIEDFRKEVLDQDLREMLKRETEAVRNVILAHAFSKSGLIDESVSKG